MTKQALGCPRRGWREGACLLSVCLGSVLLIVASAVPAFAQAKPTPPIEVPSSVRLQYGGLDLVPGLVLSGGYDSNVIRVPPPGEVEVTEFFAVPQVEATFNWGAAKFVGGGALEFARYPDHSEENFNNNGVDFSLSLPNVPLRPRVFAERRDANARPEFEIGIRSRRLTKIYGGGIGSPLDASIRFGVEVRHLRTDYAADAEYLNTNLRDKLTYDDDSIAGSVAIDITPITSAIVLGEYIRDRFDYSPERDADGARYMGGIEFRPPGLFSGYAMVGARTFKAPNAGVDSFSGLVANGLVAYATDRQRLALAIYRDVAFSYDSTVGYFLANSMNIDYMRRLGDRWTTYLGTELQRLDYTVANTEAGEGRVDKRYIVTGELAFTLTEWTQVGMMIGRDKFEGATPWSAVRATAYLRYGSGRVRRLDRPVPK